MADRVQAPWRRSPARRLARAQRGYLGVATRRALGGSGSGLGPSFWMQFADAGAGAVSLAIAAGAGTVSFTRATNATCWSSGGVLLTVSSGVARSMYTELTGATYLGYWSEETRTNYVLQNRDLTNAAWTKTNVTAAKDQTGIDGVANSASSLTATASNGTCTQAITLAAVNRPLTVYVKQITGTGGVDLALDGATYTHYALTGSITRIVLVASQLNPTVSLRIPVNGDKVYFDYVQLEDSGGAARSDPTTPIATAGVAVIRNGDVLTVTSAGNASPTAGTMYAETCVAPLTSVGGSVRYWLTINDGTTNNRVSGFNQSGPGGVVAYRVTSGGASQLTGTGSANYSAANTVTKQVMDWSAASADAYLAGALDKTSGAAITVPANFTTIGIGVMEGGGGNQLNGGIKNAKVWPRVLPAAEVAAQ